jgi:hypothetical protein
MDTTDSSATLARTYQSTRRHILQIQLIVIRSVTMVRGSVFYGLLGTAAFSNGKPASSGQFCDRCPSQGHDKRNTLYLPDCDYPVPIMHSY